MNVLYEDPFLLLCEKPAGVISEEGGLPDLLRQELGLPEIYCVHRLDRETGGLMIYAKTRNAAAELSRMMSDGLLQKEYWAVVQGDAPERGELRDLLYRDAAKNKSYVVSRMRRGVREAELVFQCSARREGLSLLRVCLKTGRSHQIRVQFSSRGLPLAGDRKYGSRFRDCPLALWAARLSFPHPFTGRVLSQKLPPPDLWPWTVFADILRPNPGSDGVGP